ncbi:PP2C family protein-serine/threonine phosphatase [Streptomyces sp. NPDC087228]|uniref:PP2C family protein-serine/threonine phosphatase n=1 Tax=Streptomyces sp. NPDC087228 TaxID=3365772 RepID=UPI0038179186
MGRYTALLPGDHTESLATAVLAEIPDDGSAVGIVNCGHPPPLLFHAGAVREVTPTASSPPINMGALLGEDYRIDAVSFAAGDQLLLYTDGVTETHDRTGAFFPLVQHARQWDAGSPSRLLKQLSSSCRRKATASYGTASPGLGEADLQQVGAQLRLDVLPGEQLLAPVGVLFRAGHRDVTSAQFLGEGGEDHRLEVLADKGAGPVVVADGLLPVQRGEGDIDRAAVLVPFRDVVAGGLVPAGVPERVQDAAVLGGRRKFQVAGQVVHRGAVLEQVPVQQHLPVGFVVF